MAYTWEGLRKLNNADALELASFNGLVGYFRLYPDNTEAAIDTPITEEEVREDINRGIEFGEEI